MDKYQMNYTQFCSTTCGTATYAVEARTISNVLLQTFFIVNTLTNTNTNTGWVSHSVDLTAYQGQIIRLRFRTTVTNSLQGPGQLEIDSVSVQTLQPTSANVTVSGRLVTDLGRPISRGSVTLSDEGGNARRAVTNQFGYYTFENVAAGATYMLNAAHKQYVFTGAPRAVTVNDEITDLDLIGSSLF
jgi:hypothetical protein